MRAAEGSACVPCWPRARSPSPWFCSSLADCSSAACCPRNRSIPASGPTACSPSASRWTKTRRRPSNASCSSTSSPSGFAACPGVADVSYVSSLPLSAGNGRRSFAIEGYRPADSEDMEIHWSNAGPNYFRTMGTGCCERPRVHEADALDAPRTAIVNEAFAPLPRRSGSGRQTAGLRWRMPALIRDHGVAETGKYVSLGEEPLPFVWLAADQRPRCFLTLVVRGRAAPAALAQPIRRRHCERRSRCRRHDRRPRRTSTRRSRCCRRRSVRWMLGLFGLLGLALAAIGIYGVMAYAVNQRTREFGVRLALGASTANVTWMVVRQGMIVAAIGGFIGLALAAAATRLMRFLLFDIKPLDPLTFAAVTRSFSSLHCCRTGCRRGGRRAWIRCRHCDTTEPGGTTVLHGVCGRRTAASDANAAGRRLAGGQPAASLNNAKALPGGSASAPGTTQLIEMCTTTFSENLLLGSPES